MGSQLVLVGGPGQGLLAFALQETGSRLRVLSRGEIWFVL